MLALCAGCSAPAEVPPTVPPAPATSIPFTATAEATSPPLPTTRAPLSEAETATLRELAADHGFSYFLAMLASDDVVRALAADWPVTFLAPTDLAFLLLPAEGQLALVEDEDERLGVVLRHTLGGAYTSGQLAEAGTLFSVSGAAVSFAQGPSGIKAGEATIVAADLETRTGTIHVIDRVIPTP